MNLEFAEGRMQTSTLNGAVTTYVWDADGRRVMKRTGSATTTFVYDTAERRMRRRSLLSLADCSRL